MDIRYVDDLHMEFDAEGSHDDFDLPVIDGESEIVLVLSGDITAEMSEDCKAGRYWSRHTNIIKSWAKRHKAVVMVAGNHEFYFGIMEDVREWWSNVDASVENFHFLDNKTVVIDGVRFIGSTLWTNMRNRDPMVAMLAVDETFGMSDFKHIWLYDGGYCQRRFTASDWLNEHDLAVDYIKSRLAEPFDGPTVVVTHHAPSHQSIPEKYRENRLNDCYASNLDSLIWYNDIALWIHGHIHASMTYEIAGTIVAFNARGYNGINPALNPDFDPTVVVTVV